MSKIHKNQVTVNTRVYVFNLRREPKGRGNWAFSDDAKALTGTRWFYGTFAEARKQAIADAAERGIYTIFVQP